jgi:KAP family P-loop domain/NB-ARC domain
MAEDDTTNTVSAGVGQVIQASSIESVVVHVPSQPPPVPRQVPAPIAVFVGRTAESGILDQLLGDPGQPACLVLGMGGIGKTALVVQWANRVADRFPEGQVFVDMRGYSTAGTPLSPNEALASVLDALGVASDRLPADLDARSALFRSMVSTRRLLIVLDNVAAAEQVPPLLPGSGSCRLVLTSRRDMDMFRAAHGITTIRLKPLTVVEGREFLEQVLGEERIAAESDAALVLVEKCGGLPLALQILASHALASHRPLSELADFVAGSLAGPLDDTVAIGTVLSWTYERLPPDTARLVRLLGLHPGGSVTVAEAAALADLSPKAVTDLLDQLTNQSMLDRDGPDSYRLHPLIHSYAYELVMRDDSEQDRLAAERRLSKITKQPRQNVDWVNDAPATADRLNRGALADMLAIRLRQAQNEQPDVSFLVHLDGPWGAGKTSLLNLLEQRLTSSPDPSVVVSFNAWRHARVEPPWWALITCLRDQLIRALPWWRRPWLHIRETATRVRRSGAFYLLAMIVLVLLGAGVIALLGPISFAPTKFSDFAKAVTAGMAVLAALWSAGKVAAKLLLWDSARGARLLEQSHTNPMQEVTKHFSWLVEHAPKPVVLFIDDLDRCDEKFVVAILDAVQNLVRDAPAGTGRIPAAASFVVAADGAWLRRAYEKTYENFQGAVEEPGRPLGHLFLDKLFQLSVPMPAMGPQVQSGYLDALLGVLPGTSQELTNEVQELRARVVSGRTESDVLNALDTASPAARQAVIGDAIAKMSASEVSEATEHALQKFAPLLLANPRGMKRFVNTYSVLRILRTLEGNTVAPDALALWTIIRIRWPLLAEHLERDAEVIDAITAADSAAGVPDSVKSLVATPAVRRFFQEAPVELTPAVVRSCCGGQVG